MINKSKKIVTLGEVMMRLSAPGYSKFSQAKYLDMEFGGGEANVAIALAYLGMEAEHITRFPDNLIGKTATQFLRKHWVKTSNIIYGDEKLGHYFLERGAVHRSSKIVYDRDGSAFSKITPEMVNWEEIFKDACWFHWTGITPAISESVYETCLEGIKKANSMGVTVSADLTFRKNQWKYGKTPQQIIPEMVKGSDIIITGMGEIKELFNLKAEDGEDEFISLSKQLINKYPRIQKIADKTRESVNASINRLSGRMWNGQKYIETPIFEVTHIIDRVGTGDAFASGLIYGLIHSSSDEEALKFANASCALKHTIEGDANMVSLEDIEQLVAGDTSGKIMR